MLIAAITVGDISLTLNRVEALAREEELKFTYLLSFLNLCTSQRAEVSFTSENDALLSLAAWIAEDEFDIGSLDPHRRHLKEAMNHS